MTIADGCLPAGRELAGAELHLLEQHAGQRTVQALVLRRNVDVVEIENLEVRALEAAGFPGIGEAPRLPPELVGLAGLRPRRSAPGPYVRDV